MPLRASNLGLFGPHKARSGQSPHRVEMRLKPRAAEHLLNFEH